LISGAGRGSRICSSSSGATGPLKPLMREADRSDAFEWASDYENVQVTVFGDTAIAIGRVKDKGTDASGKPFDEHERWTDTWVKMPNGKWQCVATQASTIKK
jgi:hypothetical protein